MTKFGYLDTDMMECLDVEHILINGRKSTMCVKVNDKEGWADELVPKDKDDPTITDYPYDVVHHTGDIVIVWRSDSGRVR